MNPGEKLKKIVTKPLLNNYRTLAVVWGILAGTAWIMKFHPAEKHNNFLIFRNVFHNLLERLSLYAHYPSEHHDTNHYGPVFSLLVAPFATLPSWLGLLFWLLALTALLFYAVRTLPVDKRQHIFIYWFCAHELLTALYMSQFNIATAALILLSYTFIEKRKEGWAAACIAIGTFVKLYGIIGLAFFPFSKNKIRLVAFIILWSAVMFAAPMLITSPEYIINQYLEWYQSLSAKNLQNLTAWHQNISLLGMIRKISGWNYSDIYIIIGGAIIFALPYLRFKQYQYPAFRQTMLAAACLFVVLFSTGSESSTYIVAVPGTVIWYLSAPWKRSGADLGLMILVFIITVMSPSDLFPEYLRANYVKPYALKALPCTLVWLKLAWEAGTKNYRYQG